jgi:hypothetical protein
MNDYALNTRCNDIVAEIAIRTMQACSEVFRSDVARAVAEISKAREVAWAFMDEHPEVAIDWDEISEVCF